MGLASALSTALTGLTAAETQLDVVGNNLANSQTVGFKESSAVFATQFLQTLGLGSSPTGASGGTNPRQIGLGVQVAEITPKFTQGTVEVSSSPSDLAIQGDGFFIVEGPQGERLYTRNGIFKTNSENELVTVTGNRLLGFGVDEFFTLQTTQVQPLTIPLGSAAVAQATQNVYLEGTLSPTGDLADTAQVIESSILGNGVIPQPADTTESNVAPLPDSSTVTTASAAAATTFVAGEQYEYQFTFLDDSGRESLPAAAAHLVTIGANGDAITLNNLPPAVPGNVYNNLNIYRRKLGVAAADPQFGFTRVGSAPVGGSFADNNTVVGTGAALNIDALDGTYTYRVTFGRAGLPESRPSEPFSVIVQNGRVHLSNFPPIPTGDGIPPYDTIHIYRNVQSNQGQYFLVGSVTPGQDFTDARSDASISDLTVSANREINLDGPPAAAGTLLTSLIKREGDGYEQLFQEGVLTFSGRKGASGGRALAAKEFVIGPNTTLGQLAEFMNQALGIQVSDSGAANPIPGSLNTINTNPPTLSPGVTVTSDGKLRVVSNNGVESAVSIGLSAFQLRTADQETFNPVLSFDTLQEASGQSAAADFVVFDSLGIPLDVRLTAVLESRSGTSTTYRWFADSPQNDPVGPDYAIAVGTGLVTFDGEGNLISTTNTTVSIDRRDVPSSSPLEFVLDFSQISGLAQQNSTLAAARQDGSAPGKLTSYIVGEDGVIRGVFSNGVTRDLGQIRLARFANAAGLEQRGNNLFSQGVNSGLPVEGNPSSEGIGKIIAGAVELSNTDIGQNLIDLVLATTQYRGNSRVISTAQQLLDELLNLRR